MKKIIVLLAIALMATAFGIVVINAEDVTTTTSVETTSTLSRFGFGRMGGMMGGYYTTNANGTFNGCHGQGAVDIDSYEFLYAHLSDADQATVDAKYLELLLAVDFETRSTEEQLAELVNIKTQLAEFIIAEEFVLFSYRP